MASQYQIHSPITGRIASIAIDDGNIITINIQEDDIVHPLGNAMVVISGIDVDHLNMDLRVGGKIAAGDFIGEVNHIGDCVISDASDDDSYRYNDTADCSPTIAAPEQCTPYCCGNHHCHIICATCPLPHYPCNRLHYQQYSTYYPYILCGTTTSGSTLGTSFSGEVPRA